MLFRRIDDPKLAQYAYLIGCQRSGEAIIIDPQRDVDRYMDAARREGLRIVAVAETHIHADFLSGARELAERAHAHVYVSGDGGPEWQSAWVAPYKHTLLHDGDEFKVGNIRLKAMHTPGHTPEHMSYMVFDTGSGGAQAPAMGVISGDFVFVGDLGRPDLLETAAGTKGSAEPSAQQLWKSARAFVALPDYLQVWPAHGAGSACGKALGAVPQSTVGYEKISSPILKLVGDQQRFVDDILSGQPEPPIYFARMKVLNRDGVPVLGHLPQPPLVQDVSNRPELTDPKLAVVVDTRPWVEFRRGHLPGALHAVPGKMFPMVVGSFVRPEEPIVLICDSLRSDELVRDLVRIGYDQIVAVVPPTAVATFTELVQEPEETVQGLARAAEAGAAFVLDVRGASEHAAGAVKGSMNVAYTRLPQALAKLPTDRRILVHCAAGGRSAAATAYLRRQGFDALNVEGGFGAWRKAQLPVHTPAPGKGAEQCCASGGCRA